ncbi:collagen-binding domain-containing protein [Telmatospirillum sp.]|uniref:collagen-binding domain-containing protein n=1 Tax=Telmatospirillum sp. TaxID=2079197 RepID=UPI0028443F95|nr:collagen-binding domain-containing protein [Telmatospirillum sp.]MDR3437616.1 choice-of-anchor A family protein [Telmatospirillum sp.]
MRRFFALLSGLVLSTLGASSAFAASLDAATILKDFNAVVYTDGSTSSDIEGAAVIGGNFSGTSVYQIPRTTTLPSGYGALTVFGNASGSIHMENGSNAYFGGGTVGFNGGGSYISAPSGTISDFEKTMNSFSSLLASLASNSTLPTTDNNEVIKATPGANGIAVFNITADQLAAIPSYKIDLNGASTVIFNVSGTSVTVNATDESGVTGADNIIWNFFDATTVTLNREFVGTVLATKAAVTNSSPIDGTLVAKSWIGQGELHNYGFDGNLPIPVPEPASLALLGVGLFVLEVVRRRRA